MTNQEIETKFREIQKDFDQYSLGAFKGTLEISEGSLRLSTTVPENERVFFSESGEGSGPDLLFMYKMLFDLVEMFIDRYYKLDVEGWIAKYCKDSSASEIEEIRRSWKESR